MLNKEKMSFWDDRANLPENPGGNDFPLKILEQRFIFDNFFGNARVLDLGCGDGTTLIKANEMFENIEGVGLDFSENMLNLARSNAKGMDNLTFRKASMLALPEDIGTFDIICSQRCLINLDSFEQQKEVIAKLASMLNKNGILIMVESTFDGMHRTNELRAKFNLEMITPPWHNTFFNVNEVATLQTDNFKIINFKHLSSTYYFLSRVVYAAVADKNNEPLRYDSDINMVSLELPEDIGEFGPGKGWVFKKF